ncbi:MAG: hypothetical protein ACP5E5_07340 [Acidobacteriaceae bacterium]
MRAFVAARGTPQSSSVQLQARFGSRVADRAVPLRNLGIDAALSTTNDAAFPVQRNC